MSDEPLWDRLVSAVVGLSMAVAALGILWFVVAWLTDWSVVVPVAVNLGSVVVFLGLIQYEMVRDGEESIPGSAIGAAVVFGGYLVGTVLVLVLTGTLWQFDSPAEFGIVWVGGTAVFLTESVWLALVKLTRVVAGGVGRFWPFVTQAGTKLGQLSPSVPVGSVLSSPGSGTADTSGGDEMDRPSGRPGGQTNEQAPRGSAGDAVQTPSAADIADGEPTVVEAAAATAAADVDCLRVEPENVTEVWHRYHGIAADIDKPVSIFVPTTDVDCDAIEDSLQTAFRTWSTVSTSPYVVDLHGWSVDDWPWFVVAKPDRSRSLTETVGDLSPAASLAVVDGACEAIHTAHRYNRQHLHLRPTQIEVGPENDRSDVSVLGWGVFHALFEGCGYDTTTPYTAPEQLDGADVPEGPHTDVYRLGAVAHHAVTGDPPIDDSRPLPAAVRTGMTIPPSDRAPSLPEDIDDVLGTALAIDPDDRFDSVFEFQQAIRRLQ
jgi:hypothetical protein